MEEKISIPQYICIASDVKFSKKRCLPSMGIICLVAGAVMLTLCFAVCKGDALKMTLLSLGAILAVAGLIWLAVCCGKDAGKVIYLPTGACMKSYKRYLDANDVMTCRSAVETGDLSSLENVRFTTSSNAQIHVMISKDDACALVQVLEYVPHDFMPSTRVWELSGADVVRLRTWLNKK